ncbi:putative Bacteriohemerythrin [uncultured Gammaproteobacteria bacterium]
MVITWTDELATGHPEIDADHRILTGIIARLGIMIGTSDHDEIGDILCELTEYVTIHFSREEFIMQSVRYPDTEAHQLAHCEFFGNLSTFVFHYETGEVGLCQEILKYLIQWLLDHEAKEDKCLVNFWRTAQGTVSGACPGL